MNGDGGSASGGEGGGAKAMSSSAAAAAASEKLRKSSGNSSSGASIREEKRARSRSSQSVQNYLHVLPVGSNWSLEVIGVIRLSGNPADVRRMSL